MGPPDRAQSRPAGTDDNVARVTGHKLDDPSVSRDEPPQADSDGGDRTGMATDYDAPRKTDDDLSLSLIHI